MAWYRSPSASIDSFEQLEAVLSFLAQEEHEIILVGHTNCDFSFKYQTFDRNYNIPNHVEHLGRIYDQYGFTQIIIIKLRFRLAVLKLVRCSQSRYRCVWRGEWPSGPASSISFTEVKHGCVRSETGWATFQMNDQKQLTPPSFGRDVKLGVPCLDACTVGLN